MKTTIYPVLNQGKFDSAYSALIHASDENIYFGLCTHQPNKNAGVFSFDLSTGKVSLLFEAASLTGQGTPQGKIHTPLIEYMDGRIFFATHFAYPYGIPQPMRYEGGHLFSYHPSGVLVDHGSPKKGEGIISTALDSQKQIMYLLTIPSGYLVQYDINKRCFHTLGQTPYAGGVCRAITIDQNGNVYGTFADGGLFIYNPENEKLEVINSVFPLSTDPQWESSSRGGVNKLSRNIWRCVTYDGTRNQLFGIYGTNSLAFSLDCATREIEVFGSMAKPNPKADQSYPTLSLASNEEELFFIPADGLFDYCRSESLKGWSHLLCFNKMSKQIKDLGEVTDGKRRVYGISAATRKGQSLYFVGAVEVLNNETYSNFNIINQRPFHIGIVKIDL